MEGLESIDQSGLRHPVNDRLRARDPNDTCQFARGVRHPSFQISDGAFDALGIGQQRLAKLSQTIAGGLARHQLTTQPPFQFAHAPMNRRLAEPERLAGCNRTLVPGDRQKMPQIIPIEPRFIMHF
ncbi:MAG: hypothetical protein ABJA75_23275 [Bradyrhizobium sp.]